MIEPRSPAPCEREAKAMSSPQDPEELFDQMVPQLSQQLVN